MKLNKIYQERTEVRNNKKHYFVSFINGQGEKVEVETSYTVARAMCSDFYKETRNLVRSDERHNEYFELTDEELFTRAVAHQDSVEDIIYKKIQKEKLYKAISSLSVVQSRRLVMYYFDELTLKEIGQRENCSLQAVETGIKRSLEKLKIFF